jgi:2-polyprenyl-3-methyl-5-hydroxy-6-metoxy-1,4-benzoquinol methylase
VDRARLFADYPRWKRWNLELTCNVEDARCFAGELRGFELSGRRLVEIGFGAGSFMVWAREQGAQVIGVEIQKELIEHARSAGFEAFESVLDLHRAYGRSFDLVVGFDLLEHLSHDEIVSMFAEVDSLLKPGGGALFRFPNGLSPFSRMAQHSDATHRTVVTPAKLSQFVMSTNLSITTVRNAYRDINRKGLTGYISKRVQFIARDLINFAIAKAYGFRTTVLDPNTVVVFREKENDA